MANFFKILILFTVCSASLWSQSSVSNSSNGVTVSASITILDSSTARFTVNSSVWPGSSQFPTASGSGILNYTTASGGSIQGLVSVLNPNGGVSSIEFDYTPGQWFVLRAATVMADGSNSQINTAYFQFPAAPHFVSVTPSTASVRVGGTVNLVASGGQNGYNWSATSGGSLVYDGANAGFTASTAATYAIQVWSPAGNGYPESNYATSTITVGASEKFKVPLAANNSGRPIEYLFIANGITVGSAVQNIGAKARVVEGTLPPEIPSGTPVKVFAKALGIEQDEESGVWTEVEGAVTQVEVTTVTPSVNPPDPTSPDFIGPKLPDGWKPSDGDQSGKGVWSSPPTTGALSDKAFKEGVDKITSAIGKLGTGSSSGGGVIGGGGEGGEGGDLSTVVTAVNETTAALKSDTVVEDLADLDGTAATQKADGLVDSAIGLLPDAPQIVAPSSESVLSIPFVAGGQSYSGSVDFAQWSGPIAIFRGLCSACMLIFFVIVFIRTIRGAFATT